MGQMSTPKEVVLVTGGAGFVGSHVVVELISNGYNVTVVDDLSNSDESVLGAICSITGSAPEFYRVDVRNRAALDTILHQRHFDAVIHLAGRKSQPESFVNPLAYHDTNVGGFATLASAASDAGVTRVVVSSSASVYGTQHDGPLHEDLPVSPESPYARDKAWIEAILCDWAASNALVSAVALRYFNPVGAHPSGLLGERPTQPANLVPLVGEVLCGKRESVRVCGLDFPTSDGSCERDFFHVVDCARGHVLALQHTAHTRGVTPFNLGGERAHSVLEVIHTLECVSGKTIPWVTAERRQGDAASLVADCTKARKELGWTPRFSFEETCKSYWDWLSLTFHLQ